jgi:hypothetical protein
VRGQASPEERIELGHKLVLVLEEMDLDTREKISVLFVAVLHLWLSEELPIELFDVTAAATRKNIVAQASEPSPGEPQ